MKKATLISAVLAGTAIVWTQAVATYSAAPARGETVASILVYHRFGPTVADSMTIRTATFKAQLEFLKAHHYVFVPLRSVVDHLLGKAAAPPPQAIVVTADDGHKSVFSDMLPLVREYRVPVTLFIYPSAISNASYAMTWAQLRTLHETGLFDIQSHTYWHPNFKTEKKRLAPDAYRTFATMQLCKPKAVLKTKLGVDANLLAWPFGIYNDELIGMAEACGYVAGVTLDARGLRRSERALALPRFLVTDAASGPRFAAMLPPPADSRQSSDR